MIQTDKNSIRQGDLPDSFLLWTCCWRNTSLL